MTLTSRIDASIFRCNDALAMHRLPSYCCDTMHLHLELRVIFEIAQMLYS